MMNQDERKRVTARDRRPILWLLDTDNQLADDFALAVPGWSVCGIASTRMLASEIAQADSNWPDLVVFDLLLEDDSGSETERAALDALRLLRENGCDSPCVGYVTHLSGGVSSVAGLDCRLYSKLDVGPMGVLVGEGCDAPQRIVEN